jgi:hypothetical protein
MLHANCTNIYKKLVLNTLLCNGKDVLAESTELRVLKGGGTAGNHRYLPSWYFNMLTWLLLYIKKTTASLLASMYAFFTLSKLHSCLKIQLFRTREAGFLRSS